MLGKEFVIATDHKALVSAVDENKSNKTYQSRLTRWVDRLLPYQFKVIHLPGKDMGIVDYLSRNPKGETWPESVLDEKFVVTSIESFYKALDCLNSRLSDHDRLDRNENVLEYSRIDKMYQIRTRHLPVAMATKTVQNRQSTTGTKEMKIHVRINEKSLKTQKSVYLKIVSKYSRSNQLKKSESYQIANQKICIQAKHQREEKKKRWSEFRIGITQTH